MRLASKPSRLTMRQKDARVGWLLVLPSLLIILGVTLQPILSTLYLSFFNVPSGLNLPRTFIGLDNYTSLLGDRVFRAAVSRTMYFMGFSVGLELLLGMGIAQLLH